MKIKFVFVFFFMLFPYFLFSETIYVCNKDSIYQVSNNTVKKALEVKDAAFLNSSKQAPTGLYAFDVNSQDFALYDVTKIENKTIILSSETIKAHVGSFINAYVLESTIVVFSRDFVGEKGFKTSVFNFNGKEIVSFYCPLFVSSCVYKNGKLILSGGTKDDSFLKILQIDINTGFTEELFRIQKNQNFLAVSLSNNQLLGYTTERLIQSKNKELYLFEYKNNKFVLSRKKIELPQIGLCFFGYPVSIGSNVLLPVATDGNTISYLSFNVSTSLFEKPIPIPSGSSAVLYSDSSIAIVLGFHYYNNPNEFSLLLLNSKKLLSSYILASER